LKHRRAEDGFSVTAQANTFASYAVETGSKVG